MYETYAERANLEVALPAPARGKMSEQELARRLTKASFGTLFSDHMVVVPYEAGEFGRGRLAPYGPFSFDPALSVLHHGQAIFEGFKAYRQPGGGIKTFRPQANARRFAKSARRLAMPEFPQDRFVAAVDALVALDRSWVPGERGSSLYLRPVMIATEARLGVRPANRFLFYAIAAPVVSYFPGGSSPVNVWISHEYCRAAPGGTGEAKCPGNYAGGLVAQAQAQQEGCDQVVWLDAVARRYVEEMGGMNIMFVFRRGDRTEVVTPPLGGTILEGVTRMSLLTLARGLGYETSERAITVEEWQQAAESGDMTEAFACGTAAVVTAIGQVKSRLGSWTHGDGSTGPVTRRLRDALLDIQHGTAADPHEWMHTVVP